MSTVQKPTETCPECQSRLLKENGETYCTECGLVVNESHTWKSRRFTKGSHNPGDMDEQGNDAMHDKGLGSQISWGNEDANGEPISNLTQLNRLRDWQKSKQWEGKQLNRRRGLSHIHRISSSMDLDESTRHDAAQLFWDAHDENLAVGTGLYKIAVACAFIASRRSKTLRDLEEWTEKTGIDKSKLHMLVSLVQRELEVGYEPITPMDYIERELDNFDISERNRERVYELVKMAQEGNVHVGKQPQSIVAAAIYLAVDWFTQDEVGEKVGVTRKTIRKSYKEIEAVL